MDALLISGAMAAGSNAVSIFRGLVEAVKATGKAEAVQQVIDAQCVLMEMLEKQHQLTDANRALAAKVEELEAKLRLAPKVHCFFSAYWAENDDGSFSGPYSTKAWDEEKKLVRLSFDRKFSYNEVPVLEYAGPEPSMCVKVPISFMREKRAISDTEINALKL